MAIAAESKFLFSIFIANDQEGVDLRTVFESLAKKFSANARADAETIFGQEYLLVQNDPVMQVAPPEQISFYYDPINHRVSFTGVANAEGLIEVTEGGEPQLVGMNSESRRSRVFEGFVNEIVKKAGLGVAKTTWVAVPLDELGSGFGTLYTRGMAGISGD